MNTQTYGLGRQTRLTLASFLMFAFVGLSTGFTNAAFQASASIDGNSVSTGVWTSYGSIEITKYVCPEGVSVVRSENGVDGVVPPECDRQEGAHFGYVHGTQTDPDAPWPELAVMPMTLGGATDVDGVLLIENLEATGRYLISETDGAGNRLANEEILGLYCEGDGDLTDNNDNYELTFVPANGVTQCVAYNAAEPEDTEETVVVSSGNLQGWIFAPENIVGGQTGQMVTGPAGAPLGVGSAEFVLTAANEGEILVTDAYAGTALADIVELTYQTYRTTGNAAQAPALSFEFDNDITDADNSWRGRMTYEPYHTQTVNTGAWQKWDTQNDAAGTGTGNWWGSPNALSTLDDNCPQANPCTWSEILALYPNAGIRSAGPATGLLLFKAGSGWATFEGNVDEFVIGVASGLGTHTTTYDFEPEVVTTSAETIVVSEDDMQGWEFNQDRDVWPAGIGELVDGPATPTLGEGSARLATPGANDRIKLRHYLPAGTLIADITELKYDTYRANPDGGALTIALQFDVDLGPAPINPASADARIVYEPYYTQQAQILDDAWQTWDALDDAAGTGTGNWWIAGPNGGPTCTMGNPCTWTELNTDYPGLRISAKSLENTIDTQGAMLFKAGGSWTGFDGNIDNFIFGLQTGSNVHTITYDFEEAAGPFVPGPGDVVINEIMWMGSDPSEGGSTADEWIELRNMTDEEIDLAGWTIEELGTNPAPNVVIPSGTIPANGYFLIGNYASDDENSLIADSITVDYVNAGIQLLNSGEQLTLKDASDTVIDQTPTGTWAAGNNTAGLRQSMERNLVPGDGTLGTSWHTCIDAGCATTTFWDVAGDTYGTPKAENLSENDPTSPDYIDKDWSDTIGWVPDENDEMDDSERELLETMETLGLETTLLDETATSTATSTTATSSPAIGGGGGAPVDPNDGTVPPADDVDPVPPATGEGDDGAGNGTSDDQGGSDPADAPVNKEDDPVPPPPSDDDTDNGADNGEGGESPGGSEGNTGGEGAGSGESGTGGGDSGGSEGAGSGDGGGSGGGDTSGGADA